VSATCVRVTVITTHAGRGCTPRSPRRYVEAARRRGRGAQRVGVRRPGRGASSRPRRTRSAHDHTYVGACRTSWHADEFRRRVFFAWASARWADSLKAVLDSRRPRVAYLTAAQRTLRLVDKRDAPAHGTDRAACRRALGSAGDRRRGANTAMLTRPSMDERRAVLGRRSRADRPHQRRAQQLCRAVLVALKNSGK